MLVEKGEMMKAILISVSKYLLLIKGRSSRPVLRLPLMVHKLFQTSESVATKAAATNHHPAVTTVPDGVEKQSRTKSCGLPCKSTVEEENLPLFFPSKG